MKKQFTLEVKKIYAQSEPYVDVLIEEISE